MAYKVTISDGTILEKSIESVTFKADPPPDNYYCMHTYTINSMIITGRIGAGEKTISLYEWALLPANNPNCYKEIVIEQTHADQVVRNVKFSKAFIVDYSESFSKGEGFGLFSIFIRQLAGVDIECTSEVTQQAAVTEIAPTNTVEENSLPQVLEAGVTATSIARKNRPNVTDLLAKKKMMQDNGIQAPIIANEAGNAGVSDIEKKLLSEANDTTSEIGSKLHPNVPEWNINSPARGIFIFGNTEVPLKSGAQGPGEFLKTLQGGPGTGLNAQIPTHVEGHVSGLMHKYEIKEAELFINKPPCTTGAMCRHNLNRILPPDSKLAVHFLEHGGKITTWLFEHGVPKWKVIE